MGRKRISISNIMKNEKKKKKNNIINISGTTSGWVVIGVSWSPGLKGSSAGFLEEGKRKKKERLRRSPSVIRICKLSKIVEFAQT